MELLKPSVGLIFWMVIGFGILFFILSKFAWKPILNALKEREQSIDESLRQAEKARAEMSTLVAKNEELLIQAKEERNQLLRDAKEVAEKLKADILEKAGKEAEAKIKSALAEIETQKKAAITEVKNTVGLMALDIAEKVIRKELKSSNEQIEFVNKLAKESNLN